MSEASNKNIPESLYFGDKRLDTLYNVLLDEIYDRTLGQDITVVSVVGILEKLKYHFLEK